jgi:hypothetical protein
MDSSGQNLGIRHKYYMQNDAIEMHGLPSGNKSGKYDVRITTRSQLGTGSASAAMSEEDAASKRDEDGDSLENILPLQGRGITKTVDVSVT